MKSQCQQCGRWFTCKNRTARFCKLACRQEHSRLLAIQATPIIPKSGVRGITFSRYRQKWVVRIHDDKRYKYVGMFTRLRDAIAFQKEIIGGD